MLTYSEHSKTFQLIVVNPRINFFEYQIYCFKSLSYNLSITPDMSSSGFLMMMPMEMVSCLHVISCMLFVGIIWHWLWSDSILPLISVTFTFDQPQMFYDVHKKSGDFVNARHFFPKKILNSSFSLPHFSDLLENMLHWEK